MSEHRPASSPPIEISRASSGGLGVGYIVGCVGGGSGWFVGGLGGVSGCFVGCLGGGSGCFVGCLVGCLGRVSGRFVGCPGRVFGWFVGCRGCFVGWLGRVSGCFVGQNPAENCFYSQGLVMTSLWLKAPERRGIILPLPRVPRAHERRGHPSVASRTEGFRAEVRHHGGRRQRRVRPLPLSPSPIAVIRFVRQICFLGSVKKWPKEARQRLGRG